MIVLGEKKGIEKESHFKLTVRCSCKGCKDEYLKFDVYADTADEVMRLIKEYFKTMYPEWSVRGDEN